MRSLIPFSWTKGRNVEAADPFVSFRDEMNRVFEEFARWPLAGDARSTLSPRADVSETDGEIHVEIELPGIDEKDVEVTLAGDMLTVKGEKKTEREDRRRDYHLVERSYGSFSRAIALPYAVEADDVSAEFDKGVLRVTVRKPKQVLQKTAKIPVRKG